ncbi:MAG TPA: hypothetical protein VGE12_00320 [Noviherbaspirillum sp.]
MNTARALHRLHVMYLVRRANRAIRLAAQRKAERDYLNRPHIQSEHMIGFPVIPQAKPETRGDQRFFLTGLATCFVTAFAVAILAYGA